MCQTSKMPKISENARQIVERIHEFEQRYERPAGSVTLLAVSKKQSPESIREAYGAGIRDYGENYLQEAEAKITFLQDLDVRWHFIGPIQSNKTRAIANLFHWVHSVDRLKIAQRLSEQRDRGLPPLNICIQVNLAAEGSKSGVSPAHAESLCVAVDALAGLKLRGLMAIPEPLDDFAAQRAQFHRLAELYRSIKPRVCCFDTLSMGMSGDFEAAIAEGSTMVRIGTALFGPRM